MATTIRKPIVFLILLMAGILLAMLPLQEQSFRDDFAYAQPVKHLAETGKLKLSEFTTAADITPTFWGAPFAKLFGFSFGILHLANYLMLIIGIIGFFLLLKELEIYPSKDNQKPIIFTLLLLANPWMINFTMSYMTDTQAVSWLIIALYFLTRGFKEQSWRWMITGGVAAGLSFLTRQIAISLGAGLLAALIIAWRQPKKKLVWPILAGGITLGGIIFFYLFWLSLDDHQTFAQIYNYRKAMEMTYGQLLPLSLSQLPDTITAWQLIFHRLFSFLSQMIVFSLPVFLIFPVKIKKIWSNKHRRQQTIISGLVLISLYAIDLWLNRENYLAGYPIAAFEVVPIWPWFWPRLWKYFLGAGIIFWTFIPALINLNRQKLKLTSLKVFLIITTILYFWMSISHNNEWPQYGIQLLPLIFIFLAWVTRKMKVNLPLAMVTITIMLIYSTWLARFRYQVWGKAWAVCDQLVSQGFNANQIQCNGLYSHRAWHNYEKEQAEVIKALGREEIIKDLEGYWYQAKHWEKIIAVKVIYSDSLFHRQPKIVVRKM